MILECVTWKGALRMLRLSIVIISYAEKYKKILDERLVVARHFLAGNYLFQEGMQAPVYRARSMWQWHSFVKNIITISWRAFKCNWKSKSWASDPEKASDTGREDGSKEDIFGEVQDKLESQQTTCMSDCYIDP